MNDTTGWLFCSAVIESANAGLAALCSAGSFFMRSLRSLLGPGRKSTLERDWNVGTASRTSGRSAEKNGASFGATGLEGFTNGVRSTNVARRVTNVVLALRRGPGSSARAVVNAGVSWAVAPSGNEWFEFGPGVSAM